ncbi:MAG: pilus assembly protein PilP [Bdellovibrionales bacterium]|nr:pilus assembly protein PilP [Bdellovibrionales bacterium]
MRFASALLSALVVSAAWATDPPAPAPMPAAMPQAGMPPNGMTSPGAGGASTTPSAASLSAAPAPSSPVDYKKFRDPFKEPSVVEQAVTKSELERYPITDFKVVAIITGPIRMRAMLTAPDGKTHYVSEHMKIGTRDGEIVKITTKSIVVREKVVNPLGEVEQFDSEIGMDQPASGSTQ